MLWVINSLNLNTLVVRLKGWSRQSQLERERKRARKEEKMRLVSILKKDGP